MLSNPFLTVPNQERSYLFTSDKAGYCSYVHLEEQTKSAKAVSEKLNAFLDQKNTENENAHSVNNQSV